MPKIRKENKQTNLSFFTDLLDEPYNGLIEQAETDGAIPIAYTCSYIPDVLLSVDKLLPVRVRAPGIEGTEIADIYLSNVTCSYTRSLLEFAMDDQYDFFKGWVFAASCDHLRRLYDNLNYIRKPDFIHILDVPHRIGESALSWYVDDLKRLVESLSVQFGVNYNNDSLKEAIREHNQFNELLASLGELRKKKHPLISGTEFHSIMLASLVTPKQLLTKKIEAFKDSLDEKEGISDYRARLVIVGGQLDDPGYINIIESTGGLVVADHLCTGSIPGLELINTDDDPMQAIAGHYLNRISCPRMMEEFNARVEDIMESVEEYNADGVIIEFIKFCDIWGVEANLLASEIRKRGVPALCLEREYRLTGEGQLQTRIQAFIESMGK